MENIALEEDIALDGRHRPQRRMEDMRVRSAAGGAALALGSSLCSPLFAGSPCSQPAWGEGDQAATPLFFKLLF
jgi:hypothetical protein